MKNQTLTISALTATTVAALISALGSTDAAAQSSVSNRSVVCPAGKVPGYVSTGCVNDHQPSNIALADGTKNRVKGAVREAPVVMIGLGVPTVKASPDATLTPRK